LRQIDGEEGIFREDVRQSEEIGRAFVADGGVER
jgi:hypothetical protein